MPNDLDPKGPDRNTSVDSKDADKSEIVKHATSTDSSGNIDVSHSEKIDEPSSPEQTSRPELVHHHSVIEATKQQESDPANGDDDQVTSSSSQTEDGSNIVNEFAKQASTGKSKEQLQSEDDALRQNIDNLIENKTYFVPIGQITRRRNTRLLILGVIFIVLSLAAGFYYMANK